MRKLSLLIIVLSIIQIEINAQTLEENYQGAGHVQPSETPIGKFYIGFSSNDVTNYPASYGSLFGFTDSNNGYGYSYQIYKGHTLSRLFIRFADYTDGGNKWYAWNKLLDSGNDIESIGVLKISGVGNNYINGNVGIGTTSISSPLTIRKSTQHMIPTLDIIHLSDNPGCSGCSNIGQRITVNDDQGSYKSNIGLWINASNAEYNYAAIFENGNVLIGKTSQQNLNYKLDVNGTIRANEIIVNLNGADFVFENNYKLRTLEEVESFVKKNKHLPEIDPAAKMEENGTELGELNTKLLQKIEELTLYMIDMNKEVKALKNENIELKEKVKKLEIAE